MSTVNLPPGPQIYIYLVHLATLYKCYLTNGSDNSDIFSISIAS